MYTNQRSDMDSLLAQEWMSDPVVFAYTVIVAVIVWFFLDDILKKEN